MSEKLFMINFDKIIIMINKRVSQYLSAKHTYKRFTDNNNILQKIVYLAKAYTFNPFSLSTIGV